MRIATPNLDGSRILHLWLLTANGKRSYNRVETAIRVGREAHINNNRVFRRSKGHIKID